MKTLFCIYQVNTTAVTLTEIILIEQICTMKENKSPGVDGIQIKYLIKIAQHHCTPLMIMFSLSVLF